MSLIQKLRAMSLPEIMRSLRNNSTKVALGNTPDISRIKQKLEVLAGDVGNVMDQAITFRDLIELGVVVVTDNQGVAFSPEVNTGNVNIAPPVTGPTEPAGPSDPCLADFTPPPAPTNVATTNGFAAVFIRWADPSEVYQCFAYAEIFRSQTNNLGTAVKIGQTDFFQYTDTPGRAGVFFYWVRFVSRAGVAGNFNAVSGTESQIGNDPEYVFDLLTEQLQNSGVAVPSVLQIVQNPIIINGVSVPAGVYIRDVFIANGTITSAKIGNAQITNAKILDATITSAKIGLAEIKTANIENAAISTAKIQDAAIVSAKILDAAITTAKIQDAAILSAKIADAQITTAKIQDAAINSAKILDAAITSAKIGVAEVKTANIENAAISSAKIQDAAITSAKILDAQITNAKIQNAAIDVLKIAGNTVFVSRFASLNSGTITISPTAQRVILIPVVVTSAELNAEGFLPVITQVSQTFQPSNSLPNSIIITTEIRLNGVVIQDNFVTTVGTVSQTGSFGALLNLIAGTNNIEIFIRSDAAKAVGVRSAATVGGGRR